MKLTKIGLRNFRAGQNLAFDTSAGRILIAGPNGAGKSSVRDAIQWTLRGICPGTDGKGSGWEALVPEGATQLSAAVVVEGLGSIERVKQGSSHAFTVEGLTGDSSTQQQALFLRLNTSPAFLDAVLDTGAFLRLHHAEAKAFVLALLDVKVSLGEYALTLDQLDAKHKIAFQERTNVKSRAKSLSVPQKPVGEFPPLDVIEQRLAGLRGELQKLSVGVGATAGKREALEAQLRKAEQIELGQVEAPDPAYLAELESQIAILEAEPPTAPVEDEWATSPSWAGSAPKDASAIERRIIALKAHKPKEGCVLDPELECPVAKVKFTHRAKVLEGEVGQLPTPQAPEVVQKPVPAGPTPLQQARKRLAEAQAHRAESLALEARNRSRAQEAEALRTEITTLPDVTTASGEVETLLARIQKGEIVLRSAREFWQTQTQYEKALQEKATLDAEVGRLEALVELLGPNGARVQALQAAVGPFEAQINTVTSRFGWTVGFQFDPWGCFVNTRPVETYSESEQFRIGIALQLAIAELSGLSFAVIDRLDMLDVPNRGAVTTMLLNSSLEQIVILATREPDQPLPQLSGVIAYRLSKSDVGQTVIVERVGA